MTLAVSRHKCGKNPPRRSINAHPPARLFRSVEEAQQLVFAIGTLDLGLETTRPNFVRMGVDTLVASRLARNQLETLGGGGRDSFLPEQEKTKVSMPTTTESTHNRVDRYTRRASTRAHTTNVRWHNAHGALSGSHARH